MKQKAPSLPPALWEDDASCDAVEQPHASTVAFTRDPQDPFLW